MQNRAILPISGTSALSPAPSLPSLFSRWTAYLDAPEKTVETYTRNIRRFAAYLSETGEKNPTRDTVIAFREHLEAEGKKPTTIQGYMAAVKLFFRWAEQEGLYPNIADHVKGAKLDVEHKKDPLTAGQAKKLLAAIDRGTLRGARDYAILSLMVTTGLRTVSVCSANVGDLRTAGGASVLYYKGKGHDEKAVYVKIAPPVEEAIREYLSMRGKTDIAAPLFTSEANRNAGQRMTERSVSRLAKEHMIDVGLNSDRLTAHSLRHTAATLNLLAGGTPEETQQMLGHRNINTTLIYSHALERAKNESENRIAASVFG